MGKTKKSVHMKVPAPVINWGGGGVLLDSTFWGILGVFGGFWGFFGGFRGDF